MPPGTTIPRSMPASFSCSKYKSTFPNDVYENAKQIAQCGINFNEEDTVLVRFPYALSAVAHMVHSAAQLKNACVIPASGRTVSTPFPRIVDLMKKLDVSILSCLSLQAVMIAETAEILGFDPKSDFPSLRAICTAGEPLSPARRKLIEKIWGVPVYEFYGMTEIGTAVVDCEHFKSHFIEDDFIIEILDDSLTTEVKPGEFGNLVVTTLKKKATPMIRYLTGDRARMIPYSCECGKGYKIEIRGRKEDTLFINNRQLDLWDIEEIISYLPCRRFWCAGPHENGLQIIIEKEKESDFVSSTFIKLLEASFRVKLNIQLVPRGTLYDREQLLSIGLKSKPKYLFTEEEIQQKKYIHF